MFTIPVQTSRRCRHMSCKLSLIKDYYQHDGITTICHQDWWHVTRNGDMSPGMVTSYNIEFISETKDIVFPDFGLWIEKLMIYYHAQYQYQSLPTDKVGPSHPGPVPLTRGDFPSSYYFPPIWHRTYPRVRNVWINSIPDSNNTLIPSSIRYIP